MKKNFIIILLLVLSILIGCSISEIVTIKVDSTHIEIDEMGNVNIESTKNGQRVEVQIPLTQKEKEVLSITEESMIFNNVSIDNSIIRELEENVDSSIVEVFNEEEFGAINSGIDKIAAAVKPIEAIVIVNEIKPTSGNIGTLIPTPTIIITIDFPDGTKIIFYDTDGDGDADYFVVIFPNGTRITGYVGDFVDWNWLLNFIKERLGWN